MRGQDTFYSGPQAWFFLADDPGSFRAEALDVRFTEGDLPARAVTTLARGPYDAGFGDLNKLVRMRAEGVTETPVAVMAIHARPPQAIAVDAAGPVRSAADLPGRRLISLDQDAALLLFPEVCKATGIAPPACRSPSRTCSTRSWRRRCWRARGAASSVS